MYLVDDVAIDSDEYPGDADLTAEIEALCTGSAFEDYTGEHATATARLDYFFLYPTEESWDFGDRGFTCMAVSADGSPLEDSVEGSGD